MGESWRVVIVSQALPAVIAIDAGLRMAGHRAIALVATRQRRLDSPGRRELVSRLLLDAPADLDLLVPSSKERLLELIRPLEPDLIVCSGFSWLIPGNVLDLPRHGAINIHPSLLPRYRGPAPVSWAIRNGDTELGLTIHRMDEHFDTGPILAQGTVPLDEEDDSWEALGLELQPIGAELMPRALERLAVGDPGDRQDEAQASYAGFFEDDYLRIDWGSPAREIHDQVRAWEFMPQPTPAGLTGPIAELDGRTVRVRKTRLRPGEGRRVECGDGPVWVLATEPIG